LVRRHGRGVQIRSVTNWKVRYKSASNTGSYERKRSRQDHWRKIVVTQISHASMKKYQPRPQSIHPNYDLAATGHGTAHFDLYLTRS
jgi:hypothetical protein